MIYFCTYCRQQLLERPLRVDGYRVYAHLDCFEIDNIGEE
jgi:hypothetical protein